MLDAIEAASPLKALLHETVRTVAGGLADVPAYLAGSPVAMRRRQKRETPAPLKIVVDVCTSAALSDDIIARRGVAALALMRLLIAAGHAVELWVVHANGNAPGDGNTGLAFMRLETSPMDTARAAWILSSAGFGRYIAYSASSTVGGAPLNVWPWGNDKWCGNLERITETYALGLACEPEELIVLPPMYSGFKRDVLKSDAQAASWVAERYAETLAKSGLPL